MANNKVGGKRKRQQSHSEQDKFAHKSGVLLQREAKKVRVFLVRKVVQQLKQSRGQLEAAQREHGELLTKQTGANDDANHSEALSKKDKQVKKLETTVNKLEKELEVFKALDLKAVVARAMNKTGLERKQQEEQQKKLQQQQQQQLKTQSRYGGEADSDDDDESDFGGERQVADESGDDDDGFDSEEYENSRRANDVAAVASDGSGSESESESEDEQEEGAPELVQAEPMEQSKESTDVQKEESAKKPSAETTRNDAAAGGGDEEQEAKPAEENKATGDETKTQQQQKAKNVDLQIQNTLIDRILAHNQMKPLLEAIEKVIEKDEREAEKKLRKQEKKALKRDRNEVLIGGRSSAAPTSLFLGSLSGRGGVIDDDMDGGDGFGLSSSYMDGAEDDIAEFLGEKKKKNRMGQNARRQKAIRLEEAAKRKQDRENGIFRPFGPRKDDTVSKYGPSERPKKKKPAAEVQNSKGKGSARGKPERGGERSDPRRGERGAPARASAGTGRERERGAPTSVSSSSRPAPFNAPPQVDVSHPSWIAKQKLKEKEKASITAFSGKKITFGDD